MKTDPSFRFHPHRICYLARPNQPVRTLWAQPGDDSEGAVLHDTALSHLNQAWDLYYVVFRKINKHLPQVHDVECGDVTDISRFIPIKRVVLVAVIVLSIGSTMSAPPDIPARA